MRKLAVAAALATLLTVPGTALGSGCTGDACAVIYRADAGGCIVFKNAGTRPVYIVLGNMSTKIVGGGIWKVMNIDGKTCLRQVIGNPTANFAPQH
jgi:hypothetical protein